MFRTHFDAFLLAVASSTDNFMVGVSVGLSSPSSSAATTTTTAVPPKKIDDNLYQFYKVNLVVALCNASGTLLATYSGTSLRDLPQYALKTLAAAVSSSSSPETYTVNLPIESILAGMAFLYLAWKEYKEDNDDTMDKAAGNGYDEDEKIKKSSNQSKQLSYSIAIPMTLNNLAGGVAGGVLGLSVVQTTCYAFLVSLGSMALGHAVASRIVTWQAQRLQHPNNNSRYHSKDSTTSTAASMKWCKQVSILIYILLSLQSFFQL